MIGSQVVRAHSSKRRPRVVLVHPSAGVNWSGGSEIFAIEMARRLEPHFEVELLSGAACGDFSRPAGGIARTHSYRAVRHPLLVPLWQGRVSHPEIVLEHLSSFLPCLLSLVSRPADLIFPSNDYGGLAVAVCARALTGARILYTEHSGLLAEGRCLARNLRFRPDRLVVFGETMRDFGLNLRPQQEISVIPNGVDLERFHPQGTQLDLSLPRPRIICVAGLRRNGHKRLELAIQAVSRLSEGSLLVCGDGPDRAYFQAMGEALLGSRFAICTFPFAQMPAVYRSADVFTLPSLNEPCALSYLEAMASGLPVVTTDDPMRRSTVADGGILCDVTDLDAYAAALAAAIAGSGWKEKARRNAERFGWETVALRYRDVILETLKVASPA